MRIVALGDTHGRGIWKDIAAKEENDDTMIVFIGDYFDTHGGGYSGNRQIENFKDILAYKKAKPDNVILLTGNHDFHYIKDIDEQYSGYQMNYAADISNVLQEALDGGLMQMCYTKDNYVFTHAGVTMTWCLDNEIDITDLEREINDLFKTNPKAFKFTMGDNLDNSGDDVTQPPIWVRPNSLSIDKLDGVTYVIGHTTVKKLDIEKAEKFKMILIDCLGTSQEYLIIDDNGPSVGKVIW